MEIRDYARAIGRRWRILVIVPVLAAGLALAFLLLQPPQYRASAAVVVPLPAQSGVTTALVSQVVSDFQAAITSPTLLDRVESETGVSQGAIESGLSSEQLGAGTLVEVSYTGDDQAEVSTVLDSAVRNTLALLARSELAPAQAEVEAAQRSLTDSRAALSDFVAETGIHNPSVSFDFWSKRVAALQASLEKAQAAGDPQKVSKLEGLVQGAKERLAGLTSQTAEYEGLQARIEGARQAIQDATSDLLAAQGRLDASAGEGAFTPAAPQSIARLPYIARRVLTVAAIALALAVGLVLLLEALQPALQAPRREGLLERQDARAARR